MKIAIFLLILRTVANTALNIVFCRCDIFFVPLSKQRCPGRTYSNLLYGQGCFIENENTRRIHMSLHPGLGWRIFRM